MFEKQPRKRGKETTVHPFCCMSSITRSLELSGTGFVGIISPSEPFFPAPLFLTSLRSFFGCHPFLQPPALPLQSAIFSLHIPNATQRDPSSITGSSILWISSSCCWLEECCSLRTSSWHGLAWSIYLKRYVPLFYILVKKDTTDILFLVTYSLSHKHNTWSRENARSRKEEGDCDKILTLNWPVMIIGSFSLISTIWRMVMVMMIMMRVTGREP